MTSLIRNPRVRRVGALAVLAAWAAVVMPSAVTSRQPPAALPQSAYLDDFDSAWTFIRDNYAYLEEKSVDWEQVREFPIRAVGFVAISARRFPHEGTDRPA